MDRTGVTRTQWLAAQVLIALFLLAAVGQNLPSSQLERDVAKADTIVSVAGLHQRWAMFSPFPPSREVTVHARVHHVDGSSEHWQPPQPNVFTGALRAQRWRKWTDRIRKDDRHRSWPLVAAQIAREANGDSEQSVLRVDLVRRWSDVPAPGDGFVRTSDQFMFHSFDAVNQAEADAAAGAK